MQNDHNKAVGKFRQPQTFWYKYCNPKAIVKCAKILIAEQLYFGSRLTETRYRVQSTNHNRLPWIYKFN